MPCSGRDYDAPSGIYPSSGIPSGDSELNLFPSYQDDTNNKHAPPSRNTNAIEYTSSGSPSSHSSSIVSLSSATSTSSALCNDLDNTTLPSSRANVYNAILRPTRTTFSIGPREDDNDMPHEGSSTLPSRRVVEGKGKIQERIQELTISPTSCSTNWTRSANSEQKYSQLDNRSNECFEIEDPSTYFLESSSSCDHEDDDFADLSASIATIRPPNLERMSEPPESSASSVIDGGSEMSRASSPHSDQGYTLEVRPPSSIMATHDGEERDTYDGDDSPTESQSNSPQSQSSLSASNPGLRSNSRRQGVVEIFSPPELPPVPPVASIRTRRPRPSSQDGSQRSWSGARPSSLSDRRSAEYRATSNHASTSTARSPSLSPLAWPVAQGPTSSTSVLTSAAPAPVDYLTGSWPSEISNNSPSNPLLSTPSTLRPTSTPTLREDESHTYIQSGRTQYLPTQDEAMSSPDSLVSVPVTGPSNAPSNAPSVPQRTTRFTVSLPPSPGPSLRTSAFDSPFASGASTADSWGTPATVPGESVYNQTTSIPVGAAQWSDLPPARNSTPTWLPEAVADGHNPLSWGNAEWSAWPDPMQIPQVAPIATPSPPYITPPGYLLICSYCGAPAPACVCRRYVRVAPVATGATSGGSRTPMRPPTTAHPMFWFSDGTVTFEIEDVFFKVHKYFFERHSEHFRNLLARRSGLSPNIVPVRIPDAKKLDFERLLKVFYPSNLANPDLATVEEWTSVLTLAVKWRMNELISLSIQELTPITSAVDKISLAKKFGLFGYNLAPNSNYNRDWLLPALRELCGRNFPLRFEEARKLDMWTVVKVWEVQHEVSNTGLSHNVSQIERLIKRRFGLE